jgi:hypothetical protein
MKITFKKEIEESIEVELPAFRKYAYSAIKIIDANTIIVVEDGYNGGASISYFKEPVSALDLYLTKGKVISEEEFDLILIDTKSKINAFIMESYLIAA